MFGFVVCLLLLCYVYCCFGLLTVCWLECGLVFVLSGVSMYCGYRFVVVLLVVTSGIRFVGW